MFQKRSTPIHLGILIFASFFPLVAALIYFGINIQNQFMRLVFFGSKIFQFSLPISVWILTGKLELPEGSKATKKDRAKSQRWALSVAIGTSGFFIGAVLLVYPVLAPMLNSAPLREAIVHKLSDFGASTPLSFGILALVLSVAHSFLEEYYWRGFVLTELISRFKTTVGVWMGAIAFTLHHIVIVVRYAQSEPRLFWILLGSSCVLLCGWIWSVQYARTRKIWIPWISHVVADFIVMGIGYDLVFHRI